jgi:hypothetical protein
MNDPPGPKGFLERTSTYFVTLISLMITAFCEEVTEAVSLLWALWVAYDLSLPYPDLFAAEDDTAFLKHALKYVAPHGDLTKDIMFVTHWCPDEDNDTQGRPP